MKREPSSDENGDNCSSRSVAEPLMIHAICMKLEKNNSTKGVT